MTNNNNRKDEQFKRVYKPVPLLEGIEEIRQDFEERLTHGDVVYGIEILDDCVETIRKGSVTYIIARPNVGKSAWSQTIAVNLAKQGKKVMICSCEMGAALLMERQLTSMTGISNYQLRELYEKSRDKANYVLDSVFDSRFDYLRNIDICETGGATVFDIISMLNCFPEFNYIIIDYIQRISGQGKEYEVISQAAKALQTYARQTGKAMIICSQASRASEKDGKEDVIAIKGKGSGSIEEDADVGLSLMEQYEGGNKYIFATLFKNRYSGQRNITYKYLFDRRMNLVLQKKGFVGDK